MSGDIFAVTTRKEAATGVRWVEARDATANHSTTHRTAATTMNYPAPNVSGAMVEKSSSSCLFP